MIFVDEIKNYKNFKRKLPITFYGWYYYDRKTTLFMKLF